MTTKASKPARSAKQVAVAKFSDPPDKERAEALAKLTLRPSVNAAVVVSEYTKPFGEQDVGALADSLSAHMSSMCAGDMKRAEAMLYGQAHALQSIFMSLARRATTQEYMKNWEAYLRMALKAQNQCRMTLETLATIKNPPVVFARQANINNGGQQQVNNGTQADLARAHFSPAGAHAANPAAQKTELLEGDNLSVMERGIHGARTCSSGGGSGADRLAVGRTGSG